jgi:hypothetical protein
MIVTTDNCCINPDKKFELGITQIVLRRKVNTAEIRTQEEDFGTLGLSGGRCEGRRGLKIYEEIGGNEIFPKIKK